MALNNEPGEHCWGCFYSEAWIFTSDAGVPKSIQMVCRKGDFQLLRTLVVKGREGCGWYRPGGRSASDTPVIEVNDKDLRIECPTIDEKNKSTAPPVTTQKK